MEHSGNCSALVLGFFRVVCKDLKRKKENPDRGSHSGECCSQEIASVPHGLAVDLLPSTVGQQPCTTKASAALCFPIHRLPVSHQKQVDGLQSNEVRLCPLHGSRGPSWILGIILTTKTTWVEFDPKTCVVTSLGALAHSAHLKIKVIKRSRAMLLG